MNESGHALNIPSTLTYNTDMTIALSLRYYASKPLWILLQQQFQMNRYISHWFLKWLFWYIINLYGKLHLLVWKFLQKGHWKGPKKGLKNVDCANWENIPIFSKWIDRLCAPQYSKIYRFIWRRMCVITHSFLKSVRFWRI